MRHMSESECLWVLFDVTIKQEVSGCYLTSHITHLLGIRRCNLTPGIALCVGVEFGYKMESAR